jgi:signal transduction histidine kinase
MAELDGIAQHLHRETEFYGVGAGLAVCRTIAERHGAHITATAAVGQGCTVRVEWPAPPAGLVV